MTDAIEETLDPADWTQALAVAHRMVDDAVRHLAGVRDRPAWQPMPDAVRASFLAPLPQGPMPLAQVYGELTETLLPYPMGNIHPRFWGWYMGAGNFSPTPWAIFWPRSTARTWAAATPLRPSWTGRWWPG